MKKISVNIDSLMAKTSYPVLLGDGEIDVFLKNLKKSKLGRRYCVITDSTVYKLYGIRIIAILKKNDIDCDILSFPAGEKNKTMQTVESLASALSEKGFCRQDAIIALGGGVVGDVTGFLASVYMRGVPYVQIPTTLLAMVDSSIGGKTGVDIPQGKNLVGTFHQPSFVFIDIAFLKTLPVKQIRNGLAEVIKCGVIRDERLFKFIEQYLTRILSLSFKELLYVIKKTIEIKKDITEIDERDKGERMLLNYGHTYGHAIEKMSGYSLLHGYAVSIGMVLENKLAVENGVLNKSDAERIKKLLKNAGLPVFTMKIPSKEDLLSDKKACGDSCDLVFPTKIGAAKVYKEKLR